jgi:hypothetical protein
MPSPRHLTLPPAGKLSDDCLHCGSQHLARFPYGSSGGLPGAEGAEAAERAEGSEGGQAVATPLLP